MTRTDNYEAQVDELPMPPRATHHLCSDCGTEYFEKKCPTCAERDRLASLPIRKEQWALVSGALTFAGPFGAPDWVHLSADGDRKVLTTHEQGGLIWVCLDLGGGESTWVKGHQRFGVVLYNRRSKAT